MKEMKVRLADRAASDLDDSVPGILDLWVRNAVAADVFPSRARRGLSWVFMLPRGHTGSKSEHMELRSVPARTGIAAFESRT